jgi:hypothetical protein
MAMFRFNIRSLLILTTVVAIALAVAINHYSRMQRLSRLHARQAKLVADHRNFLLSCSFDVPQQEWVKIDEQEQTHRQLADEYLMKSWRPWQPVPQPPRSLPILIEEELPPTPH